MSNYLTNTEFAVKSLIELIYTERNTLLSLQTKLQGLEAHFQFLYNNFISKELHEDFNDYQVMYSYAVSQRFYQQEIVPVEKEIKKLEQSIFDKEESTKALAGAILQIAKQGISLTHGNLNNCPDGRYIFNEPIKNIIWNGRNQSLHYEEGYYRRPVRDCFNNLELELSNVNLSLKIIDLLNWTTYEQYENDLKSLIE